MCCESYCELLLFDIQLDDLNPEKGKRNETFLIKNDELAKNELENHDEADPSDHFEPAMLKYSQNFEITIDEEDIPNDEEIHE